ncbi:MAG: HAD family hydrolase [Betaproteobacteria bacterium]|nr:MAG: HAD family hydrolase [Betaproteobacteria bacterium]
MIKGVIFDLDGTLVDSAPSIALALEELRARRGVDRTANLHSVRRLVSRGARELVRVALHDCGRDPDADLAEFRTIYAGIRTSPTSLYPGAAAALQALQASGVRIALCTNKPQALAELVLEHTGLAGFFNVIVGGDAIANCKPHPDHLLHTLSILSVKDEDVIYLGDSSVDLLSAKAAKIPFWLATYGYGDATLESELAAYPAAERVHSLQQLPTLVARPANYAGR